MHQITRQQDTLPAPTAAEDHRSTPEAPPCTMVIFGASGDLTKRKLIPALINLKRDKILPQNFAVIGMSRSKMSDEDFRNRMTDDLRKREPPARRRIGGAARGVARVPARARPRPAPTPVAARPSIDAVGGATVGVARRATFRTSVALCRPPPASR
jgi:hypothetical protein